MFGIGARATAAAFVAGLSLIGTPAVASADIRSASTSPAGTGAGTVHTPPPAARVRRLTTDSAHTSRSSATALSDPVRGVSATVNPVARHAAAAGPAARTGSGIARTPSLPPSPSPLAAAAGFPARSTAGAVPVPPSAAAVVSGAAPASDIDWRTRLDGALAPSVVATAGFTIEHLIDDVGTRRDPFEVGDVDDEA